MPQRSLEQGFARAVICRNDALGQVAAISSTKHLCPGQATASFGGDTEVALAIGADGPIDLRLSEQRLQGGSKEDVHLYE